MNKENQYIDNANFDAFDVPANLWDRIENGLNEQKNKRKAIIWWRIAAGIALLGGIGLTVGLLQSDPMLPQNKVTAEVNLPTVVEDTLKKKTSDTIPLVDELSMEMDEVNTVGNSVVLESNQVNCCAGTSANVNATVQLPYVNYAWTTSSTATMSFDNAAYSANFTSPLTFSATAPATTSTYTLSTGSATPFSGGPVNVTSPGIVNGVYSSQGFVSGTISNQNGVLGQSHFIGDIGELSGEQSNRSSYESLPENPFKASKEDPMSTFSIDVDGASYSDIRGMINRNELPPTSAVRLEEFVNYFPYDYPEPKGADPFSINTEMSDCPWNKEHKLVKIGIKGKSIDKAQLPTNNLVFLLDVSGSMASAEKLELLKKGFRLLVNELRQEDRVSIVVYAGAAGLVLPPTSGANKDKIMDALNRLNAGGSTAGGQGIELAYATAQEYFDAKGNNRVILATDGDFNVGISDNNALVKLIEEKRKSGVFLTVLGFGHDNFQSDKMEQLANNGNGNFSFIDNILEAKKVLVTEMGATLLTIAKDVKIQVEFNPNYVSQYRLLGYENRMLEHQDFANDTIDAGELGAGHTVTAVYEIIPPGVKTETNPDFQPELKYSKVEYSATDPNNTEWATVKFRYKEPTGTTSKLIERTVTANSENQPSQDFQFIQSVIEFGLILRHSNYAGTSNFESILERAEASKGTDPFGYRNEFILVVEKAQLLSAEPLVE